MNLWELVCKFHLVPLAKLFCTQSPLISKWKDILPSLYCDSHQTTNPKKWHHSCSVIHKSRITRQRARPSAALGESFRFAKSFNFQIKISPFTPNKKISLLLIATVTKQLSPRNGITLILWFTNPEFRTTERVQAQRLANLFCLQPKVT